MRLHSGQMDWVLRMRFRVASLCSRVVACANFVRAGLTEYIMILLVSPVERGYNAVLPGCDMRARPSVSTTHTHTASPTQGSSIRRCLPTGSEGLATSWARVFPEYLFDWPLPVSLNRPWVLTRLLMSTTRLRFMRFVARSD